MEDQVILRIVAKLMIPFILVFGFYVIAHGELGPGGGFQGGVVLASAFILYGIVFDAQRMRMILPRGVSDALASAGVILYALTGLYSLFAGYRYLDYSPLKPSDAAIAESWGMTLVEYGVGITVAAVMVTLFNELVEGTVKKG
ncbi:MAG TPA: Na(+)/H(+) antiporter subunit B [Candidatus Binatia bacterium]